MKKRKLAPIAVILGLLGMVRAANKSEIAASLCSDNGWTNVTAVGQLNEHFKVSLIREFSAKNIELGFGPSDDGFQVAFASDMDGFKAALSVGLKAKPLNSLVLMDGPLSDELDSALEEVVLDLKLNSLTFAVFLGSNQSLEIFQIISTPRFKRLVKNRVEFEPNSFK